MVKCLTFFCFLLWITFGVRRCKKDGFVCVLGFLNAVQRLWLRWFWVSGGECSLPAVCCALPVPAQRLAGVRFHPLRGSVGRSRIRQHLLLHQPGGLLFRAGRAAGNCSVWPLLTDLCPPADWRQVQGVCHGCCQRWRQSGHRSGRTGSFSCPQILLFPLTELTYTASSQVVKGKRHVLKRHHGRPLSLIPRHNSEELWNCHENTEMISVLFFVF